LLLNFLRIRVIVNGKDIYHLTRGRPAVIPLTHNNSKIVASDGYHITKPVELVFGNSSTYYFRVVCPITNDKILAGLILLVLLYLVGLLSNIFILKILCFIPILYFLYLYYINRKEFIQIRPA